MWRHISPSCSSITIELDFKFHYSLVIRAYHTISSHYFHTFQVLIAATFCSTYSRHKNKRYTHTRHMVPLTVFGNRPTANLIKPDRCFALVWSANCIFTAVIGACTGRSGLPVFRSSRVASIAHYQSVNLLTADPNGWLDGFPTRECVCVLGGG